MMSFASANNIQYRLTAEGGVTRLVFHHRAMGTMPADYLADMPEGWDDWMEQVRTRWRVRAWRKSAVRHWPSLLRALAARTLQPLVSKNRHG